MANKKNKGNKYIFIERPKLAIVISLVIMLAGLLMMTMLPMEEYPSITPPQVIVSASYPGASADVIEASIAAPIEETLNGVQNMLYMQSNSTSGSYSLTIYFAIGSDASMNMINVQNRLQLVLPRLPEESRRYGLQVRKALGGAGIWMIAVKADESIYSPLYIANYTMMNIENELERTIGVDDVNTFGGSQYAMRIWLDVPKLNALSMDPDEVMNAIRQQSTQVRAGDLGVEPMIEKQMMKLTMRTPGRYKEPHQFANIVVRENPDGSQVRIKDIGRVELGAEDYTFFSRLNGKRSTIVSVKQLPDGNAISIVNDLNKKMAAVTKSLLPGVEWEVVNDETVFMRESIGEVVHAIVLAVILVSIVTYLFLGTARAAFIPFCAIPASLIGVFIFMKLMGFSINLLILFALVLAVGLVVDDAIVVLENTQRHIQEGKDPVEAAELTMKEVLGAVVATSLVLMSVFVPVSFLGGITGQMYRQFAVAIATSIGLSAVVALTLSPALCSMMLKRGGEKPDFEFIKKFDDWFDSTKEKYLGVVESLIKSPKLTLTIFAGIILGILIMFKLIPGSFLPSEDRGIIITQIQLPDGSTASRTDMVAKEVEDEVAKFKGVKNVITMVGYNGENTALIIARLDEWSKRKSKKMSMQYILTEITKKYGNYPSAIVASFAPPPITGLGMFGGVTYELLDRGDRTPQELYDEAMKLIAAANQDPSLSMVYTSYTAGMPQLMLTVDVERALAQDVDVMNIYSTLEQYFSKNYVNDFNRFGRVYRVYAQADAPYRENINSLDGIFVQNRHGKMVPLLSVVQMQSVIGPYTIPRFNMRKSVTINAMAKQGVSSGQAMKAMEELSLKVLPKDVGFAWSGTAFQEQQTGGQLGGILAMSLIFVYLFLVALYESWTLPVTVLLISPIALVGALFLQYVWGYALDLYAQIGLVMLIGLSTKQAILIVEFAKDAHRSGLGIRESAMQAAALRFRAVMMTNIAFILGLLPLVFANGAGAASRHSIGTTVTGGMLAVAFIGTFLVPAFFTIVEEGKVHLRKKWGKG